jgi:Lar family restriction alleviation protein
MSEQNELKPCPFCGGEAKLITGFPPMDDSNFVDCPTCRASSLIFDSAESAVANWNRRFADERKTDEQRVKQANLIGMAQSMDMFREDMIEAGVIDDNVPPMFMTEAILGYIGKLRAGTLTGEQIRDAALEEAANVCDDQSREWNSDSVVTEKNYAAHCANEIRALMDKEGKS